LLRLRDIVRVPAWQDQFILKRSLACEAFAPEMQDVSIGPRFASIKIDSANLARVLASRDGTFVMNRTRGALGFHPI
jgi:hypothetical protein